MAQQTINVGAVPNDPAADTLRSALTKSNSNFNELYTAVAAIPAPISAFTTGDAKLTLKTVADVGWIMANDGTIGDASSGATTRAHADTQALFILLWTNVLAVTVLPGGRGATALADFNAHKTINLPKTLGRSLAGAGAGVGLTNRALGSNAGNETETPQIATMASHTHTDNGHSHYQPMGSIGINAAALGSDYTVVALVAPNFTQTIAQSNAVILNNGGSAAFNILDPSVYWNVMIKL